LGCLLASHCNTPKQQQQQQSASSCCTANSCWDARLRQVAVDLQDCYPASKVQQHAKEAWLQAEQPDVALM
jgi:hypothetical protein